MQSAKLGSQQVCYKLFYFQALLCYPVNVSFSELEIVDRLHSVQSSYLLRYLIFKTACLFSVYVCVKCSCNVPWLFVKCHMYMLFVYVSLIKKNQKFQGHGVKGQRSLAL